MSSKKKSSKKPVGAMILKARKEGKSLDEFLKNEKGLKREKNDFSINKIIESDYIQENNENLVKKFKQYSKSFPKPKNEFEKTNLKINFINDWITDMYGKPDTTKERELFGLIGESNSAGCIFLQACIYSHDINTMIISELKPLLKDLSNYHYSINLMDDILISICVLSDALELNLAYCSYLEGDTQEELFKSFGFKDSDLPTDKDCKIMLRKYGVAI